MSLLGTLERRRQGDEPDVEIDPRIDARRREVLDLRRARRKRRLFVAAVVATLVALVYLATHSALLDVDDVVVTGATHTTDDLIRATTGISPGDHLVSVDTVRAEQQLRALPWVQDATVERSWAGTVTVAVTERTPVVAVAGAPAVDGTPESGWLLVDHDRRVLAVAPDAPPELPVIRGVVPVAVGQHLDGRADDAIRVAEALSPGVRSRVTAVSIDDGGAILLDLRPAGVVRFGSASDLALKNQSLQTVFGQVDLTCLAAIDLRVPDAPVLTRDRACA